MTTSNATVGVVVVTHGRLAEELVAAARIIVGAQGRLRALSIGWQEDVDVAREAVRRAIAEEDEGRGVLVLTDMFGGTPTNISLSFLAPGKVEIITGVNLPMLVKCASMGRSLPKDLSLREVADRVAAKGRDSVKVAGDVLDPEEDKP